MRKSIRNTLGGILLATAAFGACDKSSPKPKTSEHPILPSDAIITQKICNQGTPLEVKIYSYYFPWDSNDGKGSYALINNRLSWYLGDDAPDSKWLDIDSESEVNPWKAQLKRELQHLKEQGRYSEEGEFYPLPKN